MESNALMHYGVLGMKWGVHKYVAKTVAKDIPRMAKTSAQTSAKATARAASTKLRKRKYSDRVQTKYKQKIAKKVGELNSGYGIDNAITDYRSLGSSSVKRINNRMNKGSTYRDAYVVEMGRKAATKMAAKLASKAVATFVAASVTKAGTDYIRGLQNERNHVKFIEDVSVIVLPSDQYKVIR